MSGSSESRWPTAWILGYGTFGGGSPAARRYHRRTAAALVVLLVCMVAAGAWPQNGGRVLASIAPGAVFLYIVWEFRRYLLAIDELARRMQFEALAWTYLVGLVLAIFIGGIAMMAQWTINPMWFLALEPVRGAVLYFVTRRY